MPKGVYLHKKGNKSLIAIKDLIRRMKGNKIALGYKHTEKAKRQISLFNKGKKISFKTRMKIRTALIGKHPSTETLKKLSESHKGYVMPEEQKRKISEHHRNKVGFGSWLIGKHQSSELIEKRVASLRGKHRTEEARRKMSESHKGEKSYLWKGGISTENKRIRKGIEFRLWRESVFARDSWICQNCGQRGGNLHPHHIKKFADFPELRFAIDNGQTLCVDCHKLTDNYGSKDNKKNEV